VGDVAVGRESETSPARHLTPAGARFGELHEIGRSVRVCAVIAISYVAALVMVSLSTPGIIVNIGDNYCYNLWCLRVKQVNPTTRDQDILYTADVRLFVDCDRHADHIPAEQENSFFYVLDDQGRRYPLLQDSFGDADVTVQPGESVNSSFAFLAPPDARKLYLMGEAGQVFLPWMYLGFGSDISLLHRRALLRIL
jgi:hypothetical protein